MTGTDTSTMSDDAGQQLGHAHEGHSGAGDLRAILRIGPGRNTSPDAIKAAVPD